MTREQIICDECKTVKGEANHWHELYVIKDRTHPVFAALVVGPNAFGHIPGDADKCDLCGERCLMLHINRLLKLNGTGPLPTRDEQRELEKQSA